TMRERDYIRYLRGFQNRPRGVLVGIGDDAAVIKLPHEDLCVLTTDMLLEGTHFCLKGDKGRLVGTGLPPQAERLPAAMGSFYRRLKPAATIEDVGRKAIACNVSDVAAMGCKATLALVAISFPVFTKMGIARRLFQSMRETALGYGVSIIGGDTISGKGPLCICVTLLGRAEGLRPVTRSGARPGDAILVTGSLGGSILGRHLSFQPRMEESLYLNKNYHLHSMIDVSDGLSLDLGHIMEESKVGAVLYEEGVPVSRDARRLSRRTGLSPLHHALTDGEDYELLFTLDPREAERLLKKNPLKVPVALIGHIRREKGLFLQSPDGKLSRLKPQGYEHW
ncbi:MAG: thiamine-phosphate kinase, partial [Candidatus Brocadiales bacterium]